jgi:hypothetical protein
MEERSCIEVAEEGPPKGGEQLKLATKVTPHPEQVSQSGTYKIRNVKPPQETRHGPAIILNLTDAKKTERSLFVSCPPETSKNTNLARLIVAFGADTEEWVGKRIRVTVDQDGKRRIDPLAR